MDDTASMHHQPILATAGPWDWDRFTRGTGRASLATAVAKALTTRRWFGAKSRAIESLEIVDAVVVSAAVRLLLARINFRSGPAEVYQVPLGFAGSELATRLRQDNVPVLIRIESAAGDPIGVLYDALGDVGFCGQLLELFESPRALRGAAGEVVAAQTPTFGRLRGDRREVLIPRPLDAEQSNSSVIYGTRLILKVFRRVETGLNPDFEISEYLTRRNFANSPRLAGSLAYCQANEEPWALAMLQQFVPNQGDAWTFTLNWLDQLLSQEKPASPMPSLPRDGICLAARRAIPEEALAAFGDFLARVKLLGQRTAELHLALAADVADPAFAPESYSDAERHRFFERSGKEASETFALLGEQLSGLPGEVATAAASVVALEPVARNRYRRLAASRANVAKIRCHGDYHLGQVLVADDDFVIIDFEGEPARPVGDRREKQLALRDVAGMIRSLHYASCSAAAAARVKQARDDASIAAWTHAWYAWSSVAFLAGYIGTAEGAPFLPAAIDEFEQLLDGCLLEKAVYELRYELNNRPDWVHLPLAALIKLLGESGPHA